MDAKTAQHTQPELFELIQAGDATQADVDRLLGDEPREAEVTTTEDVSEPQEAAEDVPEYYE